MSDGPHPGAARRRVDSPKNPAVKELVRLRERRVREREGRFVIEGGRETVRGLGAGVALEALFLCPELLRGEGAELAAAPPFGVEVVELARGAFERASVRQNPDGVLAVARTPRRDPAALALPEAPLLLVVDGLEKPGNLGALLRTADGAGVDAVLVTGGGTDLENPNVIRASMGSVFAVPTLALPAEELHAFLRARGVRLVAAAPAADTAYWDADLRGPVALAVGAEHEGLAAGWLEHADLRVAIPMRGAADSLNAATAGALLVYEALRQRRAGA